MKTLKAGLSDKLKIVRLSPASSRQVVED